MKARLHIALGSVLLMAIGYACSAPDPGDITFTPRYVASADGGSVGGGGDGGSGGGTDGGGGGGDSGGGDGGGLTFTGAFAGDVAYKAGPSGSGGARAKGQGGHMGLLDAGDPTGMNCLNSTCHSSTGAAKNDIWAFAGTAYVSATQTAEAGVEIRVIGTDGKEYGIAYTDQDGNFWQDTANPANFPAGATAGARNSNTSNHTMAGTASAACNLSGCHAAGANLMFFGGK